MILGIDIGGTNVKFGVCDETFKVYEKYSIKTKKDSGDIAFIDSICKKINEIKKDYDITQIGIGTPGTIDYDNGVLVRASNLPYKNTPVIEIIKKETGIECVLCNDATCAVYGELYAGLGKEFSNIVMLTLGTGVGGGIIIDKKVYTGKKGGAGEFGHFTINFDGHPCPCGQRGCMEQYTSVTALIRQTKEAIDNNPDSLLAKMGENGVSGKTAFDAMRNGCSVGARVVDTYTDYLTISVLGVYFALRPDVIVLGGAISNEKEYILKPIREKLIREKLIRDVDVRVSELGNDAGIIGAAVICVKNSKH